MAKQKSLWKSKTVWSAIAMAALAIIQYFGTEIPVELYTIVASFGLYGLRDAINSK